MNNTPAQNNFENAWNARHESRKNVRNLPDEVSEQALKLLEDLGLDYAKNDAFTMYDELAINGGLIEKDEATDEDFDNAVFATDHYLVMNW